MRKSASAAIALTLTIVVAVIVVEGCTRPKPTQEPSAQVMASPTIEAPAGATVVAVEATPTLVPTGEMPVDLTLTLAASTTATDTPTATPTSPPGVPTHTPTPSPTTPPGTPGASTVHVVQRGENLFRIALRYNTTVEAIAAANGIRNTQLIYVGQRLTIPGGGGTTPPPGGGRTHVVQPGENLFRIALRYGTTAQAIAAANNLPNIHLIYVGQVLRIP
ncbi:MAG: LysM domain-containing protein [Anaerolineae bacterium]